jgi:co-chaperonin GroES (HSP10)
MNSLNHFIVRVEKTHNDSIKSGDAEIFIDPKYNPFEHRICYGEVVSSPVRIPNPVKAGDTLFFHHHVTENKALSLGDNQYCVLYDDKNGYLGQAIAYRDKQTGELGMLSDWIFMQPIPEETGESVTASGIVIPDVVKKKDGRRAIVYKINRELEEYGVEVGDVVGFDKNSDYKMTLDNGEVVYRMKAGDISHVEKA